MINNIKEMLSNNNTMTTAVTLAAGGYLINLLKSIPLKLIDMFVTKITKSIYVTSDELLDFIMVENTLYTEYEDMFKNHITGSKKRLPGTNTTFYSISPGRYTKIDWKRLSVINVMKSELSVNNYNNGPNRQAQLFRIRVSVYGFKSNEILESFKKAVNKYSGLIYDPDKYIKIITVYDRFGEDPVKLTVKKDRSNIYDKRTLNLVDRHLEKFIENESLYTRIGDTYKTGILLHGKPGTGKSCIAKYIANKLNATVVTVKPDSNGSVIIPNYSEYIKDDLMVVLIEEIDKAVMRMEYNYNTNKITYIPDERFVSMLLQFMDGIITPNKCVFVATTNNYGDLPEALVRRGRFDLTIEMNGIERSDAEDMCRAFGADISILGEPDENGLYNPSELRNALLLNSYNKGDSNED